MPINFDRYGNYSLVPEDGEDRQSFQRVTNLAKILDDPYGLNRWKFRMGGLGLAARPDLIARIAAASDDDKKVLDELMEEAMQAGGASSAANFGIAMHEFCERLDNGEDLKIPEQYRADVDAYRKATAHMKMRLVEATVILRGWQVAGTLDRIVEIDGELYILDLKSGQSISYAKLAIAIQMACYAHADTIYNPGSDTHSPMLEVNQHVGLVAHFPVGSGQCNIIPFNLDLGWEAAQLAIEVREMRKQDFETAFGIAVQAPIDERRAWLVRRVQRLINDYPEASNTLATIWPKDVPTLKQEGHDSAQLSAIVEAVIEAEAQHRVPFFDEDEPTERKA